VGTLGWRQHHHFLVDLLEGGLLDVGEELEGLQRLHEVLADGEECGSDQRFDCLADVVELVALVVFFLALAGGSHQVVAQ
jgi:hypothetical protein